MMLALYILIALVVTGAALYLLHTPAAETETPAQEQPTAADDACCGMHITCERDSLLSAVSEEIVYYDDEELDRFQGTAADDYDDQAIEEFRNVLLTLLPDDIAGWARSIQLRQIELPTPVRDELLLIVAEERQRRTNPSASTAK